MTTVPKRDGAGVHARTRTPSVQLHRLVERLARAIEPGRGADADGQALELASFDGARLVINPRSVLIRLLADDEFLTAFSPGEEGGFVCDIDLPPIGTIAKVGGRLLPGSEAATSKAIDQLHVTIGKVLDRALEGQNLGSMCFDNTRTGIQRIADSVNEKLPQLPPTAKLVPVAFPREPRLADERAKDIARVFTATETINGADGFETFLQNVATRLRRDDVDEDQIDAIVATLRTQRQLPGSQLGRFLDFLDDEALSRVRLQVSMRIMQAIADQGTPLLKRYVSHVRAAYEAFASADGDAMLLDASAEFGINGRADLAEHLRKAMFYSCLPVWAEWAAQLYESRMSPGGGFKTVREVSYRFRVNGVSPQHGEMKRSFDTRLDHLQMIFDAAAEERSHPQLPRNLAQLVFLYLVIPSDSDEASRDLRTVAGHIADDLLKNPKATINTLLQELRRKSSVMQTLAKDLIAVLQNRSKRVLEAAAREVDSFTVAVHKGVVNWDAVTSMTAPEADILVRPERGDPKTAWFDHLSIADGPTVPGSIVSYSVETRLTERSLAPAGEARDLQISRPLDDAHLPVRLVPFRKRKIEGDWIPEALDPDAFDAGRGIDVQYDTRLLTLTRKGQDRDKDRKEHLRSATATAFLIVVYVLLWEVLRRIREFQGDRSLAATLVRVQLAGKEARDDEGSAAVYAVSQALEKALARELPIKLQGFVSVAEKNDTLRWRRRGAVHALAGGQPLAITSAGGLDKVALVNYVTRPCDTHPMHSDAAGFLFVSRTYQAQRVDDKHLVRFDRMQSRYVETSKGFDTPQLILEELARLGQLGFEHVMLLSHHYGNRHIGRAAERHAPHSTREFLDGALARDPSMNVYTLRRDVFPAFRLRQRQAGESGFEVTEFADHQAMYHDHHAGDTRAHIPIYTFATLVTPDERGRPQSGFCTYFFDIEERISDVRVAERVRQNVLGVGAGAPVRASLINVLRAVHFLESEKPSDKNVWLPVLDPFSWMTPSSNREAGELTIMSRRMRGEVLLSFPALLSHVTKVLHKERG